MAHDNLPSASVGIIRGRNFIAPRRAKEGDRRNLTRLLYLASPFGRSARAMRRMVTGGAPGGFGSVSETGSVSLNRSVSRAPGAGGPAPNPLRPARGNGRWAHEVRRFCGQTDDPHPQGGGQDDETDGRKRGAGASNEHRDGRADRTGASARHPDGPVDQADASVQRADGPGRLTDAGAEVPDGRRGRPDGSNQKTDAGIHLPGASVDGTGGRARLR